MRKRYWRITSLGGSRAVGRYAARPSRSGHSLGSYPAEDASKPCKELNPARQRQEYPIPQQKGMPMFGDGTKRAAFVAIAAVGFGSPAIAQMQCGGYADAVAFLYERYGESLTVQGIDGAAYLALAGELSRELHGK